MWALPGGRLNSTRATVIVLIIAIQLACDRGENQYIEAEHVSSFVAEQGSETRESAQEPSIGTYPDPEFDGTLRINIASRWPISSPDGRGLFDRLVSEAARRIGVTVVFQSIPAERSLRNLSAGLDDGDGPRIREMDEIFPHLVRVPEPLFTFEFVAFSLDENVPMTGWDALEPFEVGIVRGWKILEMSIPPTVSLTTTSTPELLFRLLRERRADLVIIERMMGEILARELRVEGVRVLEPPLASREMYLFLHSRHEGMVDDLADSLREMKLDGTYGRITNFVLGVAQ